MLRFVRHAAELLFAYPAWYLGGTRPKTASPPKDGARVVVVLVPGMFARPSQYGRLLDRLHARGLPTVALDFGWNVGGTIGERVVRLRAALDAERAAGRKIVIVAHSMGTLVAASALCGDSAGVLGFVAICAVFGGPRGVWVGLGARIFPVVAEMRRESPLQCGETFRDFLAAPPVPCRFLESAFDEKVRRYDDRVPSVVDLPSASHMGPFLLPKALDAVAEQVAELAR